MTSGTLGHEYFEELSALSSVGEISAAQYQELADHLRTCAPCREAHADFIHLTHDQLPLATAEASAPETAVRHGRFLGQDYESGFAAEARARGIELSPSPSQRRSWLEWSFSFLPQLSNATATLLVLVGLFCAAGILAYRWRDAESRIRELTPQMAELSSRNIDLQRQLDTLSQQQHAPTTVPQMKAEGDKASSVQLKALSEQVEKDNLTVRNLTAQLSAASERVAASDLKARESEQELHESERNLLAVQSELASLRAVGTDSGQKAARAVEVTELSRRVHEQEELINKQQQLLAVDQDVRNLMSARNLHITDIFDVDGKGKRKSAFGRVFYTEGKSLIFYAFDLDAPKFADAKHSFQAWGQLSDTSTTAVNLGIFYVDDPAQKRWTLRFDNPAVLDKLSAVFVTVEPHGGASKPSGQKLMYAYLGHTPNHP